LSSILTNSGLLKYDYSLYYGWALASHGSVHPIQDIICDKESNANEEIFPKDFKIKINGKEVIVRELVVRENNICDLTINGHKSSGFITHNSDISPKLKEMKPNMDLVELFRSQESQELVLSFSDRKASNESITGGKGSSLCLLKSLSQMDLLNSFTVPDGFIVTTNAYQLLLQENPILNQAIETLQSISWFVV
jgi:hypothetical protein